MIPNDKNSNQNNNENQNFTFNYFPFSMMNPYCQFQMNLVPNAQHSYRNNQIQNTNEDGNSVQQPNVTNTEINQNNQNDTTNNNQQHLGNNQFQQFGMPYNPTEFFNPYYYMQFIQQMNEYYSQQFMIMMNQMQQSKEDNKVSDELTPKESQKSNKSQGQNRNDILRNGLPKVGGEDYGKKIEVPEFAWIDGQQGRKVACLHGVVFHKNNGNCYRCKYGENGGTCPVTATIKSENDWKYNNGDQFSHDHPIVDYFNHVQSKENIKVAKDESNSHKTSTELEKVAKIAGSTRRQSTNIRQIEREREKKSSPS